MNEQQEQMLHLNRKVEAAAIALVGIESIIDYCIDAKFSAKVMAVKLKHYIQETKRTLQTQFKSAENDKTCGKLYDFYDKRTNTCVGYKPCGKREGHASSCGPKTVRVDKENVGSL